MNWVAVFVLVVTTVAGSSPPYDSCNVFSSCLSCSSSPECSWCGTFCSSNASSAGCEVVSPCPMWTIDLAIASPVIFLCGSLAAAAGLGGGGLFIACFILLNGLSAHAAIPLSFMAVFGVSCGSVAFLLRSRHPNVSRPLIDFALCLLLEPLTLMGAIFGVFLNLVFPALITTVLLALLLLVSSYRTYSRALQMWRKEQQQGSVSEKSPLIQSEPQKSVNTEEVMPVSGEVMEMMRQDARRVPWEQVLILFLLWGALTVLVIARGGGDDPNVQAGSLLGDIMCGTWQYWVLLAATCVLLLVFTLGSALWMHQRQLKRERASFPFLASDIRWTWKSLTVWPSISVIVGAASGFVGIGGGMLQGPMLLEMGVLPQVATATTSFLVLFTSSTAALQFLLFRMLDWRLALWYWGLGVLAALTGQIVLDRVMKRFKRQSVVVILLGSLIVASALCMVAIEVVDIVHGGISWSFGTICDPAQ